MERNYMRTWLVGLAVLIGGAAVARGQEPPPNRQIAEDGPNADQALSVQPIGPIESGTIADFQLFKAPDLTQIGTNPELNYGPFFRYERLFWSLHQPSTSPVGSVAAAEAAAVAGTPGDGLIDVDTSFMKAGYVWGNRFDIGYVLDDDSGWMTSILKTNTQFDTFQSSDPTHVYFSSPTGPVDITLRAVAGIPPLIAGIPVSFSNTTRLTGIELMKTYRYPVMHDGGIWTFMYGVRYFQLHDRFDIEGFNGAAPQSFDVGINNNLVGPQVGLRWERQNDRWSLSSEFRTMIGANFQNATDWGFANSGTTGTGPIHTFQGGLDNTEFAPLGEFRLNGSYKITQNVSVNVGYTAILVSGIGRSANRMEYLSPDLGIVNGADKEHFFANGVSMGFEVNR